MKRLFSKTMLLAVLTALFLTVAAAAEDVIGTGEITGEALRLRSEPSTDAAVITLLDKGSQVDVYEVLDGWYRVGTRSSKTGYVSADYLAYTPAVIAETPTVIEESGELEVSEAAEEPVEAPAAPMDENTGVVICDNVNFRSGPSTDDEILLTMSADTQLALLDVADGWCHVTLDGQEGYVSAAYVAVKGIPLKDPKGTVTGNYVNIRSEPNTDCKVLGQVSTGAIVDLVALNDGWYAIKRNGISGYIRADYVRVTVPGTSVTATASSAIGNDIVQTALGCLGVPYVYGGASMKGFDCSGFTMYVFKQHGYSLPHTATGQWNNSGVYVSKEDLQPGDLVLFCDPAHSKGKACSHVGIYIGDNQFIHASSGSGKKIQINSLSESYYSRYYVGAKRVG